MSDRETILSGLDDDQRKVVEADASRRTRVIAGPGTGKTWSLVSKVAWLLDVEGINPESLLVLSFTRATVENIGTKVRERTGRHFRARTFDSYCTKLLKGSLGMSGHALIRKSHSERIEDVTLAIEEDRSIVAGLRHVIVDEFQDLVGVRADLVLQLVRSLPEGCGVTLLGDPCQAIYDYQVRGARETTFDDLQRVLDATRVFETMTLSVNHRSGGSCPGWLERDLAELRAAILRGDAASSGVGAAIAMEDVADHPPKGGGTGPLIDLSGRDLEKWRVGVIARTNREAMRAFQRLARYHRPPAYLRLADRELYDEGGGRHAHGDAPITVYTVHTAKGRDFDEVWLCADTIESAAGCCDLGRAEQVEEARVAYVALTRSKGPTYALPRE